MTDFRTSDRDVDRDIRSWLHEDRHEDASRVAGTVLDRVEATPRRRATWWPARRMPIMSKFVTIGLGAAAAVVALFVGAQLLGPPTGSVGDGPSQSVEPSSPGDGSLPVGRYVMHIPDTAVQDATVTVNIPAPGWFAEPDDAPPCDGIWSCPGTTDRSLIKDLGGGNRVRVQVVPEDFYNVPRNMCSWSTSDDVGELAAQIVGELAAQIYDTPGGPRARELSTPVDITLSGGPGQSMTGVVPDDPSICDEQRFCSFMDRYGELCLLSHSEPNALVTFWIGQPLDPDEDGPWGTLVVAATYWPTTSSEVLAEMNAIVDSMVAGGE